MPAMEGDSILGSTRREPPGPTGGRQVILAAMGLSVEHLRDLWRARPRRVSLTPASPSPWRGRRRGSRGSGRPCRGAPVLPGSEHGHAPRGDGSTRGDPAPGRVPPSPVSGRGSSLHPCHPASASCLPLSLCPSAGRAKQRWCHERGTSNQPLARVDGGRVGRRRLTGRSGGREAAAARAPPRRRRRPLPAPTAVPPEPRQCPRRAPSRRRGGSRAGRSGQGRGRH